MNVELGATANSNQLCRVAQPNVAANGGIQHPSCTNALCALRDVQKQGMLQAIPLFENTPNDEPTRRSCCIITTCVSKMLWKHFANEESKSAFTASEVAVDKIHPSHLWHPSRAKTSIGSAPGLNKWEGASVVNTFVLLAFKTTQLAEDSAPSFVARLRPRALILQTGGYHLQTGGRVSSPSHHANPSQN